MLKVSIFTQGAMMIRGMIWVAVLAVGLYTVSCLTLYVFQRRLLYFPDPAHYTPQQAGLVGAEEISLATPDGERLVAWYKPAPAPSPVLLYFHGNGGGLYLRRDRIEALAGAGYGVLILGYRGYSGSTGRPTEKALVADGLLAYDYLTAQGVAPSRIVLYGESLGTGIATQVASQRQTSAVILEAPYSSVAAEAKAHFGIFPIDWLLLDRFDSMAHIGRINVPLLIMHGSKDSVIPARSAHALFDAAKEPKEYVEFRHGGHNDLFNFGALEHVRQFLAKHLAGRWQ
jgi:fermentation-respiration switch protein FrsA (DUF1100 family)